MHGGLRYLATGNVGIARRSAVERGILMSRTAPHLVKAMPQLVPLLPSMGRAARALVRTGFVAGDGLRKLAGTSVWANEDEFGWHYITAERDGKVLGCLFQAAIRYPFSTRYGFYCRFGYKLELDEPQTVANDLYDRLRSPAWKVSFWKDLS